MKTAAVAIDKWKLDIFKRHLDAAGYRFATQPGLLPDTLTLKVEYEWVAELQPVIAAANQECARQ